MGHSKIYHLNDPRGKTWLKPLRPAGFPQHGQKHGCWVQQDFHIHHLFIIRATTWGGHSNFYEDLCKVNMRPSDKVYLGKHSQWLIGHFCDRQYEGDGLTFLQFVEENWRASRKNDLSPSNVFRRRAATISDKRQAMAKGYLNICSLTARSILNIYFISGRSFSLR